MLAWIAETTIVAALLAGLAAALGRLSRRQLGPSARHALWLVVLLKFVTPPLVRLPIPLPTLRLDGSIATDNPRAERPSTESDTPLEFVVVREPEIVDEETGTTFDPARPDFVDYASVMEPDPAAILRVAEMVEPPESGSTSANPSKLDPPPFTLRVQPVKPSKTVDPGRRSSFWKSLIDRAGRIDGAKLAGGLLLAWGVGALALMGRDLTRIVRYGRRVRSGSPAPAWLLADLGTLAGRIGVRVPATSIVAGSGSPLLWCLGRPRLLLPIGLVDRLDREAWRGILAHELAHLKRGDAWVGRLTLLAGWLWWWNPLFRLTRSRLETEAELACDAWVVWALPGRSDRRRYAEALLDVCASMSNPRVRAPMPALGVVGAGRFLERRLTMIFRVPTPSGPPRRASMAAVLLAMLALPGWAPAQTEPPPPPPAPTPPALVPGFADPGLFGAEFAGAFGTDPAGFGDAVTNLFGGGFDFDDPKKAEPRDRDRGDRSSDQDGDDKDKDDDDADDKDDGDVKQGKSPRRGDSEKSDAKVRAEAEMERAQAQIQEAQQRLHARMTEMQRKMQKEMEAAQAEIQKAQAELMKFQQQFAEQSGTPLMIRVKPSSNPPRVRTYRVDRSEVTAPDSAGSLPGESESTSADAAPGPREARITIFRRDANPAPAPAVDTNEDADSAPPAVSTNPTEIRYQVATPAYVTVPQGERRYTVVRPVESNSRYTVVRPESRPVPPQPPNAPASVEVMEPNPPAAPPQPFIAPPGFSGSYYRTTQPDAVQKLEQRVDGLEKKLDRVLELLERNQDRDGSRN